MRFFNKKKTEKRAEVSVPGTVTSVSDLMTYLDPDNMDKNKVLEIPAVQYCTELISGIISALPVKLYEEKNGKVKEIKDDIRLRLLNGDTGDTVNGTMCRKLWAQDYFFYGSAYAYIQRDVYGKAAAIYYVDARRVSAVQNQDAIFKDYSLIVDGKTYPKSDFIKIFRSGSGYGKGTSIISENGLIFATAYNTIKYENSVVKKGGNKKGFFTSQQQQTKETMNLVKAAWAKMQTNSQKIEDNVCVLNAGMDFKEVSNSAVEMQLNQNKATNTNDICGLFGIPSGMMSGNISEKGKENFISDTLMPLLNIFESAFDSDLLLEREKGKRYFAFDTRELTRGNILQRYNAYAVGKKNGFITLEDIRRLEDLEPIDFPFIQLGLGDVLYNPYTGDIYTPNTDMAVNLNQPTGKLPTFKNNGSEKPGEPELRFNPNHGKDGKFTSGNGLTSGGKGVKMTYKERKRVSSQIATDFPNLKTDGKLNYYENRNHFYKFTVNEFGSYNFLAKMKIVGNEDKINKLKKGGK